jgi:hypothetical protein
VNTRRPADLIAVILYSLGAAAGIAAIFIWPFLFAPIGLLLVLVAVVLSANNRRLSGAAITVVIFGFLIGASIAIWHSKALY